MEKYLFNTAMEGIIARTGEVHGRVQGVGFRYFAEETARDLGLAGWARNTQDDTVEFWVQGPEKAVRVFLAEIEKGPPASRVDRVAVHEAAVNPGYKAFGILF